MTARYLNVDRDNPGDRRAGTVSTAPRRAHDDDGSTPRAAIQVGNIAPAKSAMQESSMFQDDAEAFANLGAGLEMGRGRRAKLADMFLEQLFADWCRHGAETIAQVRTEKPDQYLKLVAALLPRHTDAEQDPIDGLTDEQLAILVAAARDALGLPPQGTDAVRQPAGTERAVPLPALSEATRVP